MPPRSRTAEEIEVVKQKILNEALKLISEFGFQEFTMRKLATRLNIAAKTIYNYYNNKDEIYLLVLTRGFELLVADLLESRNAYEDPLEKLKAMQDTYINFGITQSNYYDIMLTLYVPKFNDYLGTPLEDLASTELTTALQVRDLFTETIRHVGEKYGCLLPEEAGSYFTQLLISLHGMIALYNNNIMVYVEESPKEALKILSDRFFNIFFGSVAS